MRKKDFNCVEMKRVIQQKFARDTEGLSPEEKRRFTDEKILSDPLLTSIWKNAQRTQIGGKRNALVDQG